MEKEDMEIHATTLAKAEVPQHADAGGRSPTSDWSSHGSNLAVGEMLKPGINAANDTLAKAGLGNFGIQQAGVEIVPCTPPNMDPMKDPANPAAPNYNGEAFGPRPAKPQSTMPQDGIVTPEWLQNQQNLHAIAPGGVYDAPIAPYGGMCSDLSKPPADQKPPVDPKAPVS
jgi:hypothetical protein